LSFLNELDGFYENSFNYFSFDGAIRYDFNLSEENLVPYVAIGGSIVGAPTDVLPFSVATPTLNFSFGGTYWVMHHWGLNVQGTYKYSQEEFLSMRSHTQFSAGLVYSFSPRVLVYRVWDGRRR
jgi:predicted porin